MQRDFTDYEWCIEYDVIYCYEFRYNILNIILYIHTVI